MNIDDPRLSAYILGELDDTDRAAVEAALAADPALAAELSALRETSDWLSGELAQTERPPLAEARRAHLALLAKPPPPMVWPQRFAFVGASALAAAWLLQTVAKPPPTMPQVVRAPVTPAPARPSARLSPVAVASVPATPVQAPGNPFVFVPAGTKDLNGAEFALAPRGRRAPHEPGEPGSSLTGDIRRNAVDMQTPYFGLRNGGSAIQNWVRGSQSGLGNRIRSSNDYYYDYTNGNGAGYSPYSYAPALPGRTYAGAAYWSPNSTADIARQLTEASAGYAAAERAGNGPAAAQWLLRRNALDKQLRAIQSNDYTPSTADPIIEDPFRTPKDAPLSTFAIDVDTASYAKVRRYLMAGERPPIDEVRIEELINYFPYDYPEPDAGEPLTVNAEVAGCPWTPAHRLVRVALRGRAAQAGPRLASNFVFLIDVSGSMQGEDRLPLVKKSLKLLVPHLDERDRVAIVVYAGSAGLVLPATSGDRKEAILAAIDRLEAGGSTDGGAGIELAYAIARKNFVERGNNRVILATDGDFNVGVTDRDELEKLIVTRAKGGVFLSVLGYGIGNHQDSTLERLADKGDGNHAYIDSEREARKVLVEQGAGTLVTIAKDVKIQVEFNPARVARYRLIGYENRALAARDFNDDTKDAGELGAGHTVTALYEVEPVGAVDKLRYQPDATAAAVAGELLAVKLRYQRPEGSPSKLLEFPVTDTGKAFAQASGELRWAAGVAAFGMVLRGSPHAGGATLDLVSGIAQAARGADRGGHRAELVELVERARRVMR